MIVGGILLYGEATKEPEPEPEPGFVTEWQGAGPGIEARSGVVVTQTGSRTSVWAKEALPGSGVHYFEVTFESAGVAEGSSLGGDHFVGVVAHTDVSRKDLFKDPSAWGLVDLQNDGLWADGKRVAPLPRSQCNAEGRCFGSGDRVGVLVDMDARPPSMHFYRNGVRLEGQALSGFPPGVRIVATPDSEGVSARLGFPPLPADWEDSRAAASAVDAAARRQVALQHDRAAKQEEASAAAARDSEARQSQAQAARSAGRFVTSWSETLKGEPIAITSPSVATQNRAAHTGWATGVWGEDRIPETGMHYWEICLTIPGLGAGASLGGECFVGLVNHEMTAAGSK